jgi:hypothetical protein
MNRASDEFLFTSLREKITVTVFSIFFFILACNSQVDAQQKQKPDKTRPSNTEIPKKDEQVNTELLQKKISSLINQELGSFCNKFKEINNSPKNARSADHAKLLETENQMKKIDIRMIPQRISQLGNEAKKYKLQTEHFPSSVEDLVLAMTTRLVLLDTDHDSQFRRYLVVPMKQGFKLEKGFNYYNVQIKGMQNKVLSWDDYSKYVDESEEIIKKWGIDCSYD